MSKLILYHGSPEIVQVPSAEKGKSYNDYGRGFYCTENIHLAKEWACNEGKDGFANIYELDLDGLKILNLSEDGYSVLHWLALLMEYRILRLTTPGMKRNSSWLKENYLIDLSKYDAVVGYRADDSYFSFARAFINNEISLEQLSVSMKLGELGEQFVLKSDEAFRRIRFTGFENAESSVYYVRRKARDEAARAAFAAEAEKDDVYGLYMRDIIRKGGLVR